MPREDFRSYMTIADARSEVAADPAGILSLKCRKSVWRALPAALDERAALAARFDAREIEVILALGGGW